MWESEVEYPYSHKLLKHKKSKDQKNFTTKKNHFPAAHTNGKTVSQSDQALGQFSKRDFRPNYRSQQGQFSHTLETGHNVIITKKYKMQSDKELSQVEYYACH